MILSVIIIQHNLLFLTYRSRQYAHASRITWSRIENPYYSCGAMVHKSCYPIRSRFLFFSQKCSERTLMLNSIVTSHPRHQFTVNWMGVIFLFYTISIRFVKGYMTAARVMDDLLALPFLSEVKEAYQRVWSCEREERSRPDKDMLHTTNDNASV